MSQTLERTTLLRTSDSVITSEVDGEIMLITIDTGAYFGLNRIGSEIWRLAAEPIALEAISAALKSRFNADPTQIDQQATEFVADLVAKGLLLIADGGPGSK